MKKMLLVFIILFSFFKTLEAQVSNYSVVYIDPDALVSLKQDFVNQPSGELWNNGEIYVSNNWTNNGIVDFSILNIDSGQTNFVGNTSQVISGSNFNYFYNAVFNNTNFPAQSIDLEGDISITNTSNFVNGLINNKISNGMFVFELEANHINTSALSHVNGKVIKIGNINFNFPIGDNSFYRPAKIESINNASNSFVSEYFLEDTNINYPTVNFENSIEFVNDTEYWLIDQVTGSNQIVINLKLDANTTASEILNADISTIHIVRWDSNLNSWIDQGGLQDATNISVSALVENSYGIFTFAIMKTIDINTEPFPNTNTTALFPLFLTPNNDGYNDTWNINSTSNYNFISIKIFDRYGKLLKELNPEEIGWDGTFNNNPMPTNDYWFLATYTQNGNNIIKEYRSHFTLKR